MYGNGLANGSLYFGGSAPSSTILDGLDGGMAESFVRDAYAPVGSFRPATQWRSDVRMLRDVASKGDAGLAITKVWSRATDRQASAVQRYALATFLLGYRPGLSFYSFRDNHGLTSWRSAWGRRIGTPTGGYEKVGDSYVRQFTGGVVVVNPTGSKTHVSLGGAVPSRRRHREPRDAPRAPRLHPRRGLTGPPAHSLSPRARPSGTPPRSCR